MYFDHKRGSTCRDEHYHKGCTGRWSASISMGRDGNGKRSRARLVAPTKTELLRKVSEAQAAIETGLEVSGHYTVSDALGAFLAVGLEGLAPRTVQLQEFNVKLLKAQLGAYRLRDPSAAQVRDGLVAIARDHATRSVALCKTPWSARSGWPRPRSASAQCRRGRQDASGPEDRPGPPGVQPGADAGDPGSLGGRPEHGRPHPPEPPDRRQPGRGPGPALGSDRRPGQ